MRRKSASRNKKEGLCVCVCVCVCREHESVVDKTSRTEKDVRLGVDHVNISRCHQPSPPCLSLSVVFGLFALIVPPKKNFHHLNFKKIRVLHHTE